MAGIKCWMINRFLLIRVQSLDDPKSLLKFNEAFCSLILFSSFESFFNHYLLKALHLGFDHVKTFVYVTLLLISIGCNKNDAIFLRDLTGVKFHLRFLPDLTWLVWVGMDNGHYQYMPTSSLDIIFCWSEIMIFLLGICHG